MNGDDRLTFQDVGQYTNPSTGPVPQRALEKERFKARFRKSTDLTDRISVVPGNPYRLVFNGNYDRPHNPTPTYSIQLGLSHAPAKPVHRSEIAANMRIRNGSCRIPDSVIPSNRVAIACTCPDFARRTKTYRYAQGRSFSQNYAAGDPCVSNAYGCKHMMAANQFLGAPATPPVRL